jgi:hypothetical protein
MTGEARLARPGRAGDEHAAPAIDAPTSEHGVETGHSGRDSLLRDLVSETDGGDRQNDDARLLDEERILVRAVGGAAILHDAQAAGGERLRHPVVQDDDAVGDVLLQPLSRERAVPSLAGDDRRHPPVLEPSEQPPQLRAENGDVRQPAEERLEGVQNDTLGSDRVDRIPQADEEPLEVVLSGLLDLAPLHAHVIERQPALFHQRVEIEAQRADVLRQLLGGLLECEEHPRLIVLGRAAHEELHGE